MDAGPVRCHHRASQHAHSGGNVTRQRTEYVDVGALVLDQDNYRLPTEFGIDDQIELADYLEEHYDLAEIAQSIVAEGYRPEEPLIIVEEDGRKVVIEGNRRLATVKLLTDVTYRDGLTPPSRRELWNEFAGSAAEHDLEALPTIEYPTREDAEGSLGYRHVSGIAPWSAESKARYIAHLVSRGHSYQEIARMIGSRPDYIRRQFVAHRALQEGKSGGIDVSRAERFFGVYYRSLSNPGNRAFIELVDWTEAEPDIGAVLEGGTERLDQFLSFLFGNEDRQERPVITDSRQVDDLGRVLSDPNALGILISERDIAAALETLGGDRSSVYADLRGALGRLRRANGAAWEFANDEELTDLAKKCRETVDRVLAQLNPAPPT